MISELKEVPKLKQEVPGNEAKPGKLLRCPQEGCGKVFRSSPGYRYHLKSHDLDPRPHVCQVCHKKFKSANGLKYHLRKAHHIEPVASKQNLNGNNNANSPKDRESLSSEEDHLFNLNDSYSRGYVNGGGGSYSDRTSSIPPSPLVKSPMGGLNSPLIKNLPPISPLIKSPLDVGPYLSSSSTGSALQSPFINKDRYAQYYDKRNDFQRNGDFARSSLSEYTQQCQQANNQFRQQCQRLSTGDLSNPRLPSIDFASQRSCAYYGRRPDHFNSTSGFSDFNNQRTDELQYTSLNDVKGSITSAKDCRLFSPYKGLITPNEAKEYPGNDLVTHIHNLQCATSCNLNVNHCNYQNSRADMHGYSNSLNLPGPVQHQKSQCSLQNTEQIVPDISSPGCQLSPPTYDRNNNNAKRGASESSVETEFSDSVFQNENSNHQMSPVVSAAGTMLSPVLPSPDIIKTIKTDPDNLEPSFPVSSVESMLHSPKSLLIRRTSRSKSIPPALVINPNLSPGEHTKSKDVTKKDSSSKLRQLAEIVSASPRSPYSHSPLPTLTPSILAGDGSADWGLKSPSSKFAFPDKNFLLTPTVNRPLGIPDTNNSTDPIVSSSSHSLPPSPFLDNIQTPSFWPSQIWPTPVWLCFLKGCIVKFEQDDKAFMTSEEVADFCTTPGGRKRDNMNFYTSGMKIVAMKKEQIVNSAREIVELTFEQIIPGTQRLVAKCPVDHPFYVKHKGWSAYSPTEAMARYGISFRGLTVNDHVITSPSSNKLVHTPGNTLSPLVKSSGAQVFTFNVNETKMFTQCTKVKPDASISMTKVPSSSNLSTLTLPPPSFTTSASAKTDSRTEKKTSSSSSSSSNVETITLTFSDNKGGSRTQKLVDEFKSLQNAIKAEKVAVSIPRDNDGGSKHSSTDSDTSPISMSSPQSMSLESLPSGVNSSGIRKKRRKPLAGNEKDRRPMNGFMLFAKSMRVELTKEFPGKDNRAISKLLGERWRELSEDKREDFARMAKEMADERMKVNPDCWKRKHKKDKDPISGQPSTPGSQQKSDQLDNANIPAHNNNNNEIEGPSQSKKIKIEKSDTLSTSFKSQSFLSTKENESSDVKT